MDTLLKIVTFNVKCGWYGKTLDDVAALLREVDADIVGLQEVDVNTRRSLKNSPVVNQVEYIAEKAGYDHWYFAKALDYQGGAYGHGVLSKYPIQKSTVIWPDSQNSEREVRNVERHEIEVDGKAVTFYNCHLDGRFGAQQYAEIQKHYMSKEQYPIFVGDMNTRMDALQEALDAEHFEALPGTARIDHVIIAKDTIGYQKGEEGNGRFIIETESSDHNLIYALLTLKGDSNG